LSFDPAGRGLLVVTRDSKAQLINPAYGDAREFFLDRGAELVRFSSAGARVAFAFGGGLRVSALDDPSRVLLEYGHADNIKDIRFSEAGRFIASAGQDGMVRVWDIDTDREVSRFAFKDQVLAVRFNNDEDRVTVIARSGRVGVWPVTYDDPVTEACRGLQRNLTPEEWRRYLPDRPYRRTCGLARP